MSLVSACLWTLVRAVVLSLLAWPIIVGIERWLRHLPDSRRPIAFSVLLAPFLFPELLVGYTFRDSALSSPQKAEWLCASLLLIRMVPIGVIALLVSPSNLISAESIHCRWMRLKACPNAFGEWAQLARCYWHGPVRRVLPALSLMSLVAFQEFELAALLQTASWTDWFIAAQRVGLDRREMWRQAVWPLAMQVPLLAGATVWFMNQSSQVSDRAEIDLPQTSRHSKYWVIIYLGLALLVGCLTPMARMSWNLSSGLILLARQPTQWKGLGYEMLVAMAVSLCAGLSAWYAGFALVEWKRSRSWMLAIQQAIILPGLIGSLLLSLSMESLFQQSWLRPLYDSPIPWVINLIVWLLPRAVLLHLWLGRITQSENVHLAQILNGDFNSPGKASASNRSQTSASSATLLFRLRDQPRLLAMGLLCYWAYLDLSTAYLLAPSGMASGLVRLYNFMHFGRSAALSAESFLYFGTPLVLGYFSLRILTPKRLKSHRVPQ